MANKNVRRRLAERAILRAVAAVIEATAIMDHKSRLGVRIREAARARLEDAAREISKAMEALR